MKRITIIVTHLLGSGHLSRSLILARALRDAGVEAQLISGGMPAPHLDTSGIDFVQLPPVRSDGAGFTKLLDSKGEPASPELMQERSDTMAMVVRRTPPDLLVTELFPFGRRMLRGEFLATLTAAQQLDRPPLIFASIRDILAPPSSQAKAEQTEAWLEQYYDGVLVHSDAAVLPLEASWPVTETTAQLLHYTGFIAAPQPSPKPSGHEGDGEILVTAGGGPVGRKLFETAVRAARPGGPRWRLLVGGSDAAAFSERLNQMANGAPVLAEPSRPDYREMLGRCAAAVGQCGYNTAIDWLQAGVPGVFVPFAEEGEVEQTIRATSLSARYGFGQIAEDELTPEKLAVAAQGAVERGRISVNGLQLDGAVRSSRILADFLENRR